MTSDTDIEQTNMKMMIKISSISCKISNIYSDYDAKLVFAKYFMTHKYGFKLN